MIRIKIKTRSVIAKQVRKNDERNERNRRWEKTIIVVVLPRRPVRAIIM